MSKQNSATAGIADGGGCAVMKAASGLVLSLGAASACKGMGVSRATYYRASKPRAPLHTVRQPRRSPLALGAMERQQVLDVLHAPQYVDSAPHTVVRHSRHLQPLRGRLDDRWLGIGRTGRSPHCRFLRQSRHCARAADAARRPWRLYALQAGRRPAGRPAWASSRATAGPTFPTTTHSRNRISRP